MKKNLLTILFIGIILLSGCSDSSGTTHSAGSQNSVENVLKAGMDEQVSLNTDASDKEAIVEKTSDTEEASAADETFSEETSKDTAAETESKIVDLTEMNATMVYSEVFAMMTEPEEYMGKTIKMTGVCNRYTDIKTGADYYACIITDATACCAQGIEFQLPEGTSYPGMGETITVIGTFGSYTEDENEYYVLLDSKLL